MISTHVPVKLDAVIEGLNIQHDGSYVDATYGRGGHSVAILQALSPQGQLWVIDRDKEAIEHAREGMSDARVHIYHGSFADIDKVLGAKQVDGILFDLGVSSPQLDQHQRGFSYKNAAPLDMRFDVEHSEPVHVWLNKASFQEIADVLHYYGEEPLARPIARAIVRRRDNAPIVLTTDLADIVAYVVRKRCGVSKVHPATRTFQALRIFVNDELTHVEVALLRSSERLKIGGRLVCITFHGLETRMVKSLGRGEALLQGGEVPSITLKHIASNMTDAWERRKNPRSRSAQLIILERVA